MGQPYRPSMLKWRAAGLRRLAETGARDGDGALHLARVVPRARDGEQRGASLVIEVSGARIALARGFDAALLAEVVRALGTGR